LQHYPSPVPLKSPIQLFALLSAWTLERKHKIKNRERKKVCERVYKLACKAPFSPERKQNNIISLKF
jgi:hypothetical protein